MNCPLCASAADALEAAEREIAALRKCVEAADAMAHRLADDYSLLDDEERAELDAYRAARARA